MLFVNSFYTFHGSSLVSFCLAAKGRGEENRNTSSLSSLLSAPSIFTRHSSLDPFCLSSLDTPPSSLFFSYCRAIAIRMASSAVTK